MIGHKIPGLAMLVALACLLALGLTPLRAEEGDLFSGMMNAVDQAYREATTKLEAATTPLEKIKALYERSGAPSKGLQAFVMPEDWKRAAADIDEALRLVAATEADGQTVITGKASLYFQRGFILSNLKRYQEAIAAYNEAEQLGYADLPGKEKNHGATLWDNRGLNHTKLHEFAAAAADFDIAIEKADSALYRQHRAKARFGSGDYEGALADWQHARDLDHTVGEPPFDREWIPFNQAVAAHPRSIQPLIERARFLVKQAQARNAPENSTFTLAQMLAGDTPTTRLNPAAGLMQAALDDMNFAVELEPNTAAAWIERARTRRAGLALKLSAGERDFSRTSPVEDYSRAVDCEPHNAVAWFERGACRTALADDETDEVKAQALRADAMGDFSHAIYCAPESSGEAHFRRAEIERRQVHSDDYTLLVDYANAIAQQLKPTSPEEPALLARDSALSQAHSVRGLILTKRGQFTAALSDFDQALKYHDNQLAFLERGKLRVRRGDYEGALADLNQAVQRQPNVADGWYWRGLAHDGKGEVEVARADLQQACKLDAELRPQLRGTRYDTANSKTTAGIAPTPAKTDLKLTPPGTPLEHKNAGNALRQKGDRDGALAEYQLALLLDPNYADALNNRGAMYREEGKVDLAIADLNRAIELEPKHRAAFFNRALTWREVGEHDRERADLDRAITVAVTDAGKGDAYLERSVTREAADDSTGALEDAQRATELNPHSARAWNRLGNLQLNKQHYPEAVAGYRHALELAPDEVAPRTYLALALALQNDPGAAAELDTALTKADAEEVQWVQDTLSRALRISPDSTALKALHDRAEKADADK